MAIEHRGGIFKELVVHAKGGMHQGHKASDLGTFEDAYCIEADAVVDGDRIVSYTAHRCEVLPRDKVIEYLGEKFSGFEASHSALKAERDDIKQKLEAASAELSALSAKADEADGLRSQLAAAVAEKADLRSACSAALSERDAAVAEVSRRLRHRRRARTARPADAGSHI